MKTVFLRNDDVRDNLDAELIEFTDLCLKHSIPVCHAVEPANVTEEVIDWLITVKRDHPTLIEIIQHGYNHNKTNPTIKMEFGGIRTFDDQFSDIMSGKQLMDQHFGDLWSPVFTFPYGTYNQDTLLAINKAGYKAISSKIDFTLKNSLKNRVGRMLSKDFLFNKKISYHDSKRRHLNFAEFSVSVNLIKKYIDQTKAIHYDKTELTDQIKFASKNTDHIGILFHHRFHSDQMSLINDTIKYLKDNRYAFSTIMALIR